MDLCPDELCLRVVYICARCIDFVANEKKYDVNTRIEQAGKLLQALEDWYRALPPSFQPIYTAPAPDPSHGFVPIWIHPPAYAVAIQTFHFAHIMVILNQPSVGGMHDLSGRQRYLDEIVDAICGIAITSQAKAQTFAFTDIQALYAG